MNPSDASKPQSRSGSSAQEPSAADETELLIRVPLRDQDAPDDGQGDTNRPSPKAGRPAEAGETSSGGKRAGPGDQARQLFANIAGAAPREALPEGVDRVRSGPPPEPEAATRIRFARLHLRTGSLMTARVQYEALAATGDLDLPGLLDLAEVRWRTADLPGAGAAAQEYLAKNGDQALGFLIAAEAAARSGRQVEARRSAEIAAERLAKDLDAIFGGLPRRFNWAGISGGPAAPPVAIKIETPAKPGPKAAPPQGTSKMVSPEALWAQIVEVAQAADQAGEIAEEKPAGPKPKPEDGQAAAPAAEQPSEAKPETSAGAKAKAEPEAKQEPEARPEQAGQPEAEPEPEPKAEIDAAAEPEPGQAAEAAEVVEAAEAAEVAEGAAAPSPSKPEAAARPEPAAKPEPPAAQPWDEAVAAGSAALEAADPLLAALHYALALRMSPLAAPAVLEGIGDRRDLALELVRVDAIRSAAEASAAEEPAADEPAAEETAEPQKPQEPVRRASPEPPPPIRWE